MQPLWERFGRLQIYDDMTLIEFGDDFCLPELLAATSLSQILLTTFTPRLVAVRTDKAADYLAELQAADTPRTCRAAGHAGRQSWRITCWKCWTSTKTATLQSILTFQGYKVPGPGRLSKPELIRTLQKLLTEPSRVVKAYAGLSAPARETVVTLQRQGGSATRGAIRRRLRDLNLLEARETRLDAYSSQQPDFRRPDTRYIDEILAHLLASGLVFGRITPDPWGRKANLTFRLVLEYFIPPQILELAAGAARPAAGTARSGRAGEDPGKLGARLPARPVPVLELRLPQPARADRQGPAGQTPPDRGE